MNLWTEPSRPADPNHYAIRANANSNINHPRIPPRQPIADCASTGSPVPAVASRSAYPFCPGHIGTELGSVRGVQR